MNSKVLKPLAIVFALSVFWDLIAGFMYVFMIGTGRRIDNPAIDPFYAIFMGSFFFCFAFIQVMSAVNIQRCLFVVGCLIFGRLFYIILLYSFMFFVKGFPSTYWFTGIIDGVFVILYVLFSISGGVSARNLFIPLR